MSIDSNIPTAETVLTAINALYNNPDSKVKEEASAWLCEFQKSVYAWAISDQLLYIKRDLESCYFGSQTIRNKIQNHFAELPVESHEGLKNSLLDHVEKLNSETQAPIANQLCLALADLVCNMVQWNNSIKEILHRFSNSPNSLPYLIDVLKYIPEELNNKSMRLGQNRRYAVFGECEAHKSMVIKVLEECLKLHSSDLKMVARILSCLGSWWDSSVLAETDMLNSPLIDLIFGVLREPVATPVNTYEAASQCLMDIFYQCHDVSMFPELLPKLQFATYSLLEVYLACASQPDLTPRCASLCRVFNEQANALMRYVSTTPDDEASGRLGDLRTIECLLACTEHPSRDLCLITFNTLSYFAETVAKQHNSAVMLKTVPYFNRLVLALVHHCRVDTEDADGLEEAREFRNEVYDLMHDIECVVGHENIFTEMLSHMKQLEAKGSGWSESGACLFMISTVAKRLDPRDVSQSRCQLVSSLLPTLTQAPASFQEVTFALFGELAHWAALHPDYRAPMIEVMTAAVLAGRQIPMGQLQPSQKTTLGAALTALGAMCSAGRQCVLERHWTELLAVLEALPLLPVMFHRESTDLYEGIIKCLVGHHRNQEPGVIVQGLPEKLNQIFAVNISCLNKLIDNNIQIESNNTPSDPCVWIDHLSTVFRSLGTSMRPDSSRNTSLVGSSGEAVHRQACEPFLAVVRDPTLPVIGRIMEHYHAKPRVMERTCRLARFIVRALGPLVMDMLPFLATTMVDTYNKCHSSSFLYLGSVLTDEFATIPECQGGLIQMFEAFCGPTLALFDGDGLAQNPETLEDLFRMVSRLVQRCPKAFMGTPSVPVEQLGFLAMRSLPLRHTDANMAAGRFLIELIMFEKEERTDVTYQGGTQSSSTRVMQWLESGSPCGGHSLVEAILHSICLHLDVDRVSDLSEILQMLRDIVVPQQFQTWLDSAIQTLPIHRADGLVHATDQQIASFRHTLINSIHSDAIQEALEDFARLFR